MKFRHTLFFQADCTQPELPILRAQRIQQPFHDRLECIGKVFFLHSPGTHNTSKIQTGTSSNHPLANLNPILFHVAYRVATNICCGGTGLRSQLPLAEPTKNWTIMLFSTGRGGGSRTHSARKQRFYRPPQLSNSGAPLYLLFLYWCG